MARKPALVGTDRRQQILEAALDVFAEHGLEGATNKEIASRAGVTPGLIYFYFPHKEELFVAAFEHQARLAFAQFDFASEQESDEPPEQVMRRMVAQFLTAMDSPRSASMLRVLMRESVRCPDEQAAPQRQPAQQTQAAAARECTGRVQMRTLAAQLSTSLHDYLAAQMERGMLRPVDPSLVAQLFTSGMISVILRRASGDESLVRLSNQELAGAIVGLFLHGMLPACSAA